MRGWLKATIIVTLSAGIITLAFLLKSNGRETAINQTSGDMITLPKPETKGNLSVEEAIQARRSERSYADRPLDLHMISQLLWSAQGITGAEGEKRAAPSAGMTYPLKVYLIAGSQQDELKGVYLYHPAGHKLAKIESADLREQISKAALGQDVIKNAPVNFLITGIYERTSGRYKNHGVKYVHMEAGHAAQNMYLQCESLGLGTVVVGAFHAEDISQELGLSSDEQPLYILPVGFPAQ